jgi:hypothetical protein
MDRSTTGGDGGSDTAPTASLSQKHVFSTGPRMLTESEIEWLRRDAARVLKESRDLLDREEGKKVAIETP